MFLSVSIVGTQNDQIIFSYSCLLHFIYINVHLFSKGNLRNVEKNIFYSVDYASSVSTKGHLVGNQYLSIVLITRNLQNKCDRRFNLGIISNRKMNIHADMLTVHTGCVL